MTAFNDDSNDNKNEIERMSFADLLGMSESEGDGRVQDREDEPGSGIARLAQMVASSSILEAKRPSLMPTMGSMPPMSAHNIPNSPSMSGSQPSYSSFSQPPAAAPVMGSIPPPAGSATIGTTSQPGSFQTNTFSQPPATGQMGAAGTFGTGSIPPQQTMGSQASYGYGALPQTGATGGVAAQYAADSEDYGLGRPKKSSKTGLFIGIGVGAVVLAAAAFFLLQSETPSSEEDPELAKIQAQLDQLKSQAAKEPEPEPKPSEPVAPKEPEPVQEEAKPVEEAASASAVIEEPKEEALAKPMTRAERIKAAKAAKAAKKAAAAASKTPATPKAEKGDSKPASELGSLLDNDVASGKKPAGEIPKSPSRDDVKAAMQTVQAKSEKCSKYSKGTVQLKIIVSSDGRVTSSSPMGGTADNNAANCVAMIARTARFPRFKDPTFSINYPITLK